LLWGFKMFLNELKSTASAYEFCNYELGSIIDTSLALNIEAIVGG